MKTCGILESRADVSTEPVAVRCGLLVLALGFVFVFLVLPLVVVFSEALAAGLGAWWEAVAHPDALAAIRLTLLTVLVVLPVNVLFGMAAAWLLVRFQFPGKAVLNTLLDLPFSVSPVVVGLMYVLLFGAQGWFGPWLAQHDLHLVFTISAIMIVTLFVTLPLVARELVPLMEAQGDEEEQAALVLGARGWQMLWHVTLPKVRWGLLYGVSLSAARAMGEFGAASVVSGHIRGLTNTMPLHVEILYNEYQSTAAFAVASLLAMFALVTLLVKSWVEHRQKAA
ncbi:MAG: sulfate ABC transporter permease subunit CysW [Lautropia sp.]|nr:sulfate ABC transporter permease subunit CysW [Lautropia sp.]